MIIVREKVKAPLTMDTLKGMKVSVVSGYAVHEFFTRQYPEVTIDVVPDVQTGLRKVSFGTSDAFVENLATASYYIEKEGIANLRIAGESGLATKWHLLRASDWPLLNSILEKGLAQISEAEKKAIYKKWIPLEQKTIFTSKAFQTVILVSFLCVSHAYLRHNHLEQGSQQAGLGKNLGTGKGVDRTQANRRGVAGERGEVPGTGGYLACGHLPLYR